MHVASVTRPCRAAGTCPRWSRPGCSPSTSASSSWRRSSCSRRSGPWCSSVVTQSLFGFYLGVSFLTNHVGMPMLVAGDELGFLRRQVLTSRNLSGPSFTGFLFGGLDTQIEHHLFPTMPRANLRRARKLVRPFCAEHRIDYTEQSPWHAYREVLRHLRATGPPGTVPAVG